MTLKMRVAQRPDGTHGLLRTLAAGVLIAGMAFGGAQLAVAQESYAEIAGSFRPSTDLDLGAMSQSSMTVEVALAPSNQDELSSLLAGLYDQNSPNYQHWLANGEFEARFAPSSDTIAAVTGYLERSGVTVLPASSPFLIRATGSSSAIEAAFGTSLHNYLNRNGVFYFANASAVRLPAEVAPGVLGVVGLTNTVRLHSNVTRAPARQMPPPPPSCETPYPTPTQLVSFYVDGLPSFPYGYGGGPECVGLTPSQTNSIYEAPSLGPKGQGQGINFAVFELSWYQRSDIVSWAQTFYGPGYNPPLVDIVVDGGPLNPICPSGDTCPASYQYYAGDIEVDADIEQTLSIGPAAQNVLVYNAPNDYTGQTELDEYTRIAHDNRADVISSSWSECENDVDGGYVEMENVIFEQMALQGQSVFNDDQDTGAFGCIRSDGTTIVDVQDPSAQPWVTSVGGTSFESFNPDANPYPSYPYGIETVWNVDDLCNQSPDEYGVPGLFWCANTGAGGGGGSQWWGRPSYQSGPGVNNPYTTYGNGSTQCALAALGTPCRETPDVSANADEFTPYAEYCTGSAATPYSVCAEIGTGWFGIGGTSLSTPLWSALIGDRDGYWRHRLGNANPYLYSLFKLDYRGFFHDITGVGQSTNNNGLFPTTPGYDEATGIGTPNMTAWITGSPFPF